MNRKSRVVLGSAAALLTGCGGAPSVDVFGSFLPVWMVCMSLGVVLTFCARYVLVRTRLELEVGPVALFYPCLLVLFTSLIWLTFFR